MPVVDRSNNRILPANSRAADVASKAMKEITPVQQERAMSAFYVQGSPGILYNRLRQGMKCTCGAGSAHLGSRLGLDGKASEGTIASLMLGADVSVADYAEVPDENSTETSPFAPVNKHVGVFDTNANHHDTDFVINLLDGDSKSGGETYRDDGASRVLTLDDIAGDFDGMMLGLSDVACGVCFGSGFVGGYSPFNAFRFVAPVNSDAITLSPTDIIQVDKKPWVVESQRFTIKTVLPLGAIGVDACRVLNNSIVTPALISVNGQRINTPRLLAACKGRPVEITIEFEHPTEWTHFELQFVLSTESAMFELPRISKSADLSTLNTTEPFQILLSPNIPQLREEDVIVESTYGHVLVVQSYNPWSTRSRATLGWECQVRATQPMELYNTLPRRGRTLSKPLTTVGVHDNVTGNRRT